MSWDPACRACHAEVQASEGPAPECNGLPSPVARCPCGAFVGDPCSVKTEAGCFGALGEKR
eukprot:6739664-Pyramimonas_sp.AAC.1